MLDAMMRNPLEVSNDSSMEKWPSAVSTGTTTMAVVFDGGVVLGADTRTSSGQEIVNRASRKITQLHQRIFVCRSGSAADTQALSGFAKRFLASNALEIGEFPRVNTAASLMQLLSYQNKDNLTAGLIVAGWDKRRGGQVYHMPLGGSKIRSNYAMGGSGSSYISGLVESTFKEAMTREECVAFVKKCIAHAMSLDGSTGGMIRLFIVTENSVDEEVVTGDNLPFAS